MREFKRKCDSIHVQAHLTALVGASHTIYQNCDLRLEEKECPIMLDGAPKFEFNFITNYFLTGKQTNAIVMC